MLSERLRQAEMLAETDTLTGLGNRRKAARIIGQLDRCGDAFCVLFFDLDGFKTINDTYGHLLGDKLLANIGKRILDSVREGDVVCRWGGDEFLVILAGCSYASGVARGRQIQAAVFRESVLQTGSVTVRIHIGASVGITEYRRGESAEALMERADRLLYENKNTRKALSICSLASGAA
jgi:diguanylate cyclase (GGDEF)-like protein